jgi:predicted ThiF/HesA family dinucleotide-utilizing enzyme
MITVGRLAANWCCREASITRAGMYKAYVFVSLACMFSHAGGTRNVYALDEQIIPQRDIVGRLQDQVFVVEAKIRWFRNIYGRQDECSHWQLSMTSHDTAHSPVREPGGNAEGYIR